MPVKEKQSVLYRCVHSVPLRKTRFVCKIISHTRYISQLVYHSGNAAVPLSVINSRKASLCSVCREAQYAERYRN